MATETPHLPPTKQAAPLGAVAFSMALSAAALALRLCARRCARTRLWLDDYSAVVLFLSIVGTGIAICFMIGSGLGRDAWTLSNEELRLYLTAHSVTTAFYYLGLLAAKMTFLLQYLRVLGRRGWLVAATGVIGCAGLAEFLAGLFACVPPPDGLGGPAVVDARCIPERPVRYVFLAADAVGALAILLVPVVFMHVVAVGRPEAVVVAVVYVLGLFITILQLVRIKYVDLGANFTWANADRAALMMAELSVAMLCACALLLHPLAERLMPRWFRPLELESSGGGGGGGGGGCYAQRSASAGTYARMIKSPVSNGMAPPAVQSTDAAELDHRLLLPIQGAGASASASPARRPRLLLQKALNHTPRGGVGWEGPRHNHHHHHHHQYPSSAAASWASPRQPPPPPRHADHGADGSDSVMGLQSALGAMGRTSPAAHDAAGEGGMRTFFSFSSGASPGPAAAAGGAGEKRRAHGTAAEGWPLGDVAAIAVVHPPPTARRHSLTTTNTTTSRSSSSSSSLQSRPAVRTPPPGRLDHLVCVPPGARWGAYWGGGGGGGDPPRPQQRRQNQERRQGWHIPRPPRSAPAGPVVGAGAAGFRRGSRLAL